MEPGILKVRNKNDLFWIAGFEFVGTFILLSGICFTQGLTAAPMTVSAMVFTLGCLIGRISGCHLNGALTLCIYIYERKWKENFQIAWVTGLSGFLGATVGVWLTHLIKHGETKILKPSHDDSVLYVLLIEMFFTAIFMIVIMHVKYQKLAVTSDGVLANLLVAGCLYSLIEVDSRITDACFNPWVGISIIPYQTIFEPSQESYLVYLPAYILGPIFGGVIAAFITQLSAMAQKIKDSQQQELEISNGVRVNDLSVLDSSTNNDRSERLIENKII